MTNEQQVTSASYFTTPAPERNATLAAAGHRIEWFVWAGGEKMRHTAKMIGTWGWDAQCTCGWATRTGGATKKCVSDEVWLHKFEEFHALAESTR
jgi:N6-adenosine-specific RNA methylase IME4